MRSAWIIIATVLLLAVHAKADSEAMNNYLWVPCYNSNNVYKVNIETHEIAAIIPVGGGPSGIAVGPSRVYVTCRHSSRLYCISKTEDIATDSFELSAEIAFGIGVALAPDYSIYVVGRTSDTAYAMDQARLVKLDANGLMLDAIDLVDIQGNCEWQEWNNMCVIGIAIKAPEIMIPWQRSWDVRTGIIVTDVNLAGIHNFPFDPRTYGYRGPGAAYDAADRGWSAGDREGANYIIGHCLTEYWEYYTLGSWGNSGQIYGDVAVDRLGYVWTGSALGYLMRFDPVTHQTLSFHLRNQVKGIGIDRLGYIWVALYPLNVLKKFDSAGNQVGSTVYVGEVPLGFGDMTGSEFGRRMTDIGEDEALPKAVLLLNAYPNPFNASTQISYYLPESGSVKLAIYNLLGQKIATLFDDNQTTGQHQITWNAANLTSGVYFAAIETAKFSDVLKIALLK